MHIEILDSEMLYTGEQLRSLFNYEKTGRKGDSAVVFKGGMDVATSHMVDMEDVIKKDFIWSPLALNFIVEIFHINVETAVLYQRMLMQSILNTIDDFCIESSIVNEDILCCSLKGDDIIVMDKDLKEFKLSVSIATVSHVSGLIHSGININIDDKIPVPALGLKNIFSNCVNFDQLIQDFSTTILSDFKDQVESIKYASVKVRGV